MWHCFSSGSSGSSGSYSTCRSTAASSMTVTQTPSGRSRSAIIAALPNWGASSRPRTPQSRRCWAGRGRTSWQQHLPALVLRWRPGRQLAAVTEDAQPLAQAAPVAVGVEQLELLAFELLLYRGQAGAQLVSHQASPSSHASQSAQIASRSPPTDRVGPTPGMSTIIRVVQQIGAIYAPPWVAWWAR